MDEVLQQISPSSYKNTTNSISELEEDKQRAGTYTFNLGRHLGLIKVTDTTSLFKIGLTSPGL